MRIDTSVVRVHQHGPASRATESTGGLTKTFSRVVDANGVLVELGLSPGEAHDNRLRSVILTGLHPRTMLLEATTGTGSGRSLTSQATGMQSQGVGLYPLQSISLAWIDGEQAGAC
jgi:hypothetical protein